MPNYLLDYQIFCGLSNNYKTQADPYSIQEVVPRSKENKYGIDAGLSAHRTLYQMPTGLTVSHSKCAFEVHIGSYV